MIANNATALLNTGFLPLAGGTLTGPLTLAGNPATALQATPKQYVDSLPGRSIGDNRIINGDMRIDQRNNGASGTASGYTVDRWLYEATRQTKGTWRALRGRRFFFGFPELGSSVVVDLYPSRDGEFAGFQPIEADMVSDFHGGRRSAQPVTLSFLTLVQPYRDIWRFDQESPRRLDRIRSVSHSDSEYVDEGCRHYPRRHGGMDDER